MKRVLFTTDGSAGAMAAADHLSHVLHYRDVHVQVLCVLPMSAPSDAAGDLLQAARETLGMVTGSVSTSTARGDSTTEIVDRILAAAERFDADLIVVGACGRSAVGRLLIGSVAEGVARQADRPVLIARESALSPVVIVGVDGSAESDDAARTVAKALPADRQVLLVRAIAPPSGAVLSVDPMMAGAFYEAADQEVASEQEDATREMGDLRRELASDGRHVDSMTTMGSPAAELLRLADERNAGLIVVGARGLSGFDRILLGSVSERVVRYAHCSVLVVHPRSRRAGDPDAVRSWEAVAGDLALR